MKETVSDEAHEDQCMRQTVLKAKTLTASTLFSCTALIVSYPIFGGLTPPVRYFVTRLVENRKSVDKYNGLTDTILCSNC